MTSRITQSFAFHASPDAFISIRLQQLAISNAQRQTDDTPSIVRAEILNRNVHIISSYRLCKTILCASEATEDDTDVLAPLPVAESNQLSANRGASTLPPGTFAVGPAYEQLMAAFFPPPNLLLKDAEEHTEHKETWERSFTDVAKASVPLIREMTLKAFVVPFKKVQGDQQLDLYETLKTLSWDILFAVFMGLSRDDADTFRSMENLQETVLRGQFSLFPVSLRTPFWTSARSRGLKAAQDLGPAIRSQLRSCWDRSSTRKGRKPACPFTDRVTPTGSPGEPLSEDDIVSNARLFTSSIANKAVASLLTAFFMNLFLWRDKSKPHEGESIASFIAGQNDPSTKEAVLQSVLKETTRLSPPVIGVMRRVTQTVCINEAAGIDGTSHVIPAGHDAWLYFAGANRDPSVFDNPRNFCWDRFMQFDEPTDCGITFGLATKRCLGGQLTHQICLTVAQTVIDSGLSIDGYVEEEGVKEWLGWQSGAGAEHMARDLKQLPCQRPREPVIVTFRTRPHSG